MRYKRRTRQNHPRPGWFWQQKEHCVGAGLLSHNLADAVPSARTGLTAVFGKGTGVSLSLVAPTQCSFCLSTYRAILATTEREVMMSERRGSCEGGVDTPSPSDARRAAISGRVQVRAGIAR